MLVPMKEILDRANRENYGVSAPIVSMELDARAALEAAEICKSPVILGVVYQATPDIVLLGGYLTKLAEQTSVPVALNLDHGTDFSHALMAIKAGFTSIMVDCSTLGYEENIAQVSELVKIAHAVGVSVEAELGHVGLGSNYNPDCTQGLTDPEQALEYIKRTGIDCLAVAVGTAHGAYKGTPKIDFERLVQIKELTKFPLVLHGGSGSGDNNLKKLCQLGINKVNVANDLFQSAYTNLLKTDMTGNGIYYLWEACKVGYRTRLIELIDCFGSKGKSWITAKTGLSHKTMEVKEI